MKNMITVCMIVKNESHLIKETLKAINRYGYELVIVDTGSEDNTKEIALSYTDKIYDFKWNYNFSDARNFALKKASNEFVLMIDADEVIVDFDTKNIEKMITLNPMVVGRISIVNEFKYNKNASKSIEKVSRLFSKKYYKYEGAIHEQLISIYNREIKKIDIPLRVLHKGYTEEEIVRKNKLNRNVSMLKAELEMNSEDPYLLYQLGKTYYIMEDYKSSYDCFYKAMDIDLDINLEYVHELVECYGYCLLNMKKYKEALKIVNLYDMFSSSSDYIFLIGLIYMNNGMFNEACNEFIKSTQMKNGKVEGVNGDLAFYNIGVIYECLGKFDYAEKYYAKCKKYRSAKERIERIREIGVDKKKKKNKI